MAKQSASKREIVQQGNPSSLQSVVFKTEDELKAETLERYMRMYAVIDNRVITTELLTAYFEALKRFPLRKIEKGLKTYLEEGERWPWPGTLAEIIEDEV